ncbi:response regulator [Paucibacter sp. B2R-40]|uniref:LytR/AlgR family response regulator transcription factor n=1 Tax=Paucibacter sp. B2R-40 TaxID=2893554 RepID=UPI0021E48BAB|nr:response regulator [Paucibacter sp. B2R-40]MCV2352677.1 response regulator [Paucibacter sp. B2R-40]
MKILIVDDEPPARAKLRRLLTAMPDIEVVGEAGDADEALALLPNLQVDAALLDIQMPGISGLELALALPSQLLCVFCTAFDQYAVRAFELNAVDYLLKPFSAERLAETVQRLRLRMAQTRAGAKPRLALLSALQDMQPVAGHWLVAARAATGPGLIKLALAEVEWVAAADNYIELHTASASHLDRHTLADFLAHPLTQGQFLRVHRSHAVNPQHIQALATLPRGEAELTLSSGAKLRVSRGFRTALDRDPPERQIPPAPANFSDQGPKA